MDYTDSYSKDKAKIIRTIYRDLVEVVSGMGTLASSLAYATFYKDVLVTSALLATGTGLTFHGLFGFLRHSGELVYTMKKQEENSDMSKF